MNIVCCESLKVFMELTDKQLRVLINIWNDGVCVQQIQKAPALGGVALLMWRAPLRDPHWDVMDEVVAEIQGMLIKHNFVPKDGIFIAVPSNMEIMSGNLDEVWPPKGEGST